MKELEAVKRPGAPMQATDGNAAKLTHVDEANAQAALKANPESTNKTAIEQ